MPLTAPTLLLVLLFRLVNAACRPRSRDASPSGGAKRQRTTPPLASLEPSGTDRDRERERDARLPAKLPQSLPQSQQPDSHAGMSSADIGARAAADPFPAAWGFAAPFCSSAVRAHGLVA